MCARTWCLVPLTWCQLTEGEPSSCPPPALLPSCLSPFLTFTFTWGGFKGKMVKYHFAGLNKLLGLPVIKVYYVGQKYFQSIEKFTVPPCFLNAEQIEFLVLLLAALSVVKCCAVRGMARLKPELYFPAELFFLIPPVAFSGNRKTVANCAVSRKIKHFRWIVFQRFLL